jgi:hypothetical protein
MNTQDARLEMGTLAIQGLAIVDRIRQGRAPSIEDRNNVRRMANEARSLLAEAGYPGEAVWRGLQRSSIGTDTNFDSYDSSYWQDVANELEQGAATLASLDSSRGFRDIDFHIVG